MATLGSISKPYEFQPTDWQKHPEAELDLDTSLDEDPLLNSLLIEQKKHRRAEVIICLDTSLSMTGRKLALLGVSLAVLALQLDADDLAIILFDTEAKFIKRLGERMSPSQLLEKFMDIPAQGLTNIEAGLKLALHEVRHGKLPRQAVILMTDGRYTAGTNPEYLANKFPKLHVVQTGNPWASPRFCKNLARKGGGEFLRVAELEDLPKTLYGLIRKIIR